MLAAKVEWEERYVACDNKRKPQRVGWWEFHSRGSDDYRFEVRLPWQCED